MKLKKIYTTLLKALTGYGTVNRNNTGEVHLIDVGSLGDLPSPWFEKSDKVAQLLKFEPQDARATQPFVTAIDAALWSAEGEFPFYIYKGFGHSGSSLFEQNFEYVTANFAELKHIGPARLANTWHQRSALEKTLTIHCRTLDAVLAELNASFSYDFLKIDAQGAEYDILEGAKIFLEKDCLGLHLELFNIPLYKNIKLLPEVVQYLSEKGFELVKKMPAHGTFDSQHDCIFLRKAAIKGKETRMKAIRTVYGLS
jgi:FkbM family methyltransferase